MSRKPDVIDRVSEALSKVIVSSCDWWTAGCTIVLKLIKRIKNGHYWICDGLCPFHFGMVKQIADGKNKLAEFTV